MTSCAPKTLGRFPSLPCKAKKTDTGYAVENSKDFFLVKAQGTRADELSAAETRLLATPLEERATLPDSYEPSNIDYEAEEGKETFCKILAGLSQVTNIKELDDTPSLWQINWAEV